MTPVGSQEKRTVGLKFNQNLKVRALKRKWYNKVFNGVDNFHVLARA